MKALRKDAIPMIGRRYGRIKVVAVAGRRKSPSGGQALVYRCRCSCGAVFERRGAAIRYCKAKRQACLSCSRKHSAKSVQLPDGRTIAQIAKAAGLRLDTVYHRYIRGWPHSDLAYVPNGAPRHTRGQP